MNKPENITNLDYRVLLKSITGLSDADLICNPTPELSDEHQHRLESYVQRRLNGEPVSKIIGEREFYGLGFHVTQHVLDPRPDTETLVDAVLEHCRKHDLHEPRILELGVGSGCIGISLLKNIEGARVFGVDISDDALDVAKRNANRHEVQDRITFLHSDWFESVTGVFDIIVSNPPYIESNDIESLQVEVKKYDPILALDGGADGLEPYRIIFSQAENHLYPHGAVFVEFGINQDQALERLITSHGFAGFQFYKDLSGTNRVLGASL